MINTTKKSFTICLVALLTALVSLLFYMQKKLGFHISPQAQGISLIDKQQSTVYTDSAYNWRIAHPFTWSVKDPEKYVEGSLFEKTEIVSDETHTHKGTISEASAGLELPQQAYHTHENYIGKVTVGLHKNDASAGETLTFIRQTYDQTVFKDMEAYSSMRRSLRDGIPYYAQHLFIIPENKDYYYVLTANASHLTEEALQTTIDRLQDILNSFTPA